jgi:hypothetical protein
LFWQDALVALVFGVVDFALRRKPALGWSLYLLIAGYAAVNVPLMRILSSPLTWQMSQATGGARAVLERSDVDAAHSDAKEHVTRARRLKKRESI